MSCATNTTMSISSLLIACRWLGPLKSEWLCVEKRQLCLRAQLISSAFMCNESFRCPNKWICNLISRQCCDKLTPGGACDRHTAYFGFECVRWKLCTFSQFFRHYKRRKLLLAWPSNYWPFDKNKYSEKKNTLFATLKAVSCTLKAIPVRAG